jgi:cbb3-type cytochrome oxidase maturation protein
MTIVLLLIPLGLVLVALAAWALFWAVDSGQYDGDVEVQGLIAVERDEPSPSGIHRD